MRNVIIFIIICAMAVLAKHVSAESPSPKVELVGTLDECLQEVDGIMYVMDELLFIETVDGFTLEDYGGNDSPIGDLEALFGSYLSSLDNNPLPPMVPQGLAATVKNIMDNKGVNLSSLPFGGGISLGLISVDGTDDAGNDTGVGFIVRYPRK